MYLLYRTISVLRHTCISVLDINYIIITLTLAPAAVIRNPFTIRSNFLIHEFVWSLQQKDQLFLVKGYTVLGTH